MNSCSNMTLQDLTLYSAPGMGIYASMTRDVLLQRVQVAKRSGRPMSITADAVHFDTCAGHLQIQDSLFEGQGDDGLNVHGKFDLVGAISGESANRLTPEPQKPPSLS